MTRVAIVDDQTLVRQGIRSLLGLSDETFAKAMTAQMRLMRRTKRP